MKLTLRSAGAAESTDTAAMPSRTFLRIDWLTLVGASGKGKRHNFHAVELFRLLEQLLESVSLHLEKDTFDLVQPRALISTTRSDSGDQAKLITREPRSRWNSRSSPADSYVRFCADQRQICNLHVS